MTSDPKHNDELEEAVLKQVDERLAELQKDIDSLDADPPRWQVALGFLFLFVVVVGIAYLIHHTFPSLNGGIVRLCAWLGFFVVVAGIVLALKLWMRRTSKRIERDERELLARIERDKHDAA